jgi:hypothetical protein
VSILNANFFVAVVPEYPLHRKILTPSSIGSTLGGTIRQTRLSFAMESAKPCEEATGMERRPSTWMTEL